MFKKALLVSASAVFLTACASNWDVESVRGMAPQGGPFETALFNGYVDLASAERAEYDWDDAAYFLDKARAAGGGATVLPDAAGDRALRDAAATAEEARAALMAALDAGARTRLPAVAAEAQVAYDCWVQELEEGFQPDDIEACKARFDEAMKQLAMPEPVMVPAEYTVYFKTGATELDAEARATLNRVAANYAEAEPARVVIAGHTDTVGGAVDNLLLSQRRAEMVANYLETRGVPTAVMALEAYGEEQPAVPTGDDVSNDDNRRVEISFAEG